MPTRAAMQEKMAAVKGMGLLSDNATSLPVTGYPLGPLIDTAMVLTANFYALQSGRHNREALHGQDYDMVIWPIETGGRTMFRFVRQVLQAASADQVSDPNEDVRACFLNNRDRFSAALGGRSQVPVTGIFFTSLHDEKFKVWAFKHRKDIWGALYGDAPPPG